MKRTITRQKLIENGKGQTNHCYNCRYLYMDGETYMCSRWQGKRRHKNLTEIVGGTDEELEDWLMTDCETVAPVLPTTTFQLF